MSVAAFIRAGSGLLFVLLGALLLWLGRRPRAAALAIGSYCVLFGIGFVITNAFRSGTPEYSTALGLVALKDPFLGLAALAVAFLVPTPLRREDRPIAAAGIGVAAVWAGVEAWYGLANLSAFETGYAFGIGSATRWALLTSAIQNGGAFGLLTIWALRYPRLARTDADAARAIAHLTVAVSVFMAFSAASDALNGADANYYPFGPGAALVMLAVALLWLANLRVAPARTARRVVWSILFLMLVGAACVPLLGGPRPFLQTGAVGIARSVGWITLVFALARTRVVEFDLTFAAQRRGSIAAAALATLFIVAQVMQNFLADEFGLLAGGVAAGALLFMAEPVHRTAERLLRPAAGSPGPPPASQGAADAFRDAVRLALRGGPIGRAEERPLAHLATRLGLSYQDALQIVVEEESRGAARRPMR